ncbi:MAG: FAD-dependent oxidoreductase [Opitutaceae bacterium]|nr:FAD-dependent oxidoreductase [Opitutaceae bacterium]
MVTSTNFAVRPMSALTPRLDLHTGKPLWLEHTPAPLRRRRLRRDLTCDVAVVGAGITGALVAHQLLAAGLRVVMLEKSDAGHGSTAASTGLLLYQPDSSIAEITRRHGRHAARRVYQLGRKAIQELGALARELDPACGWNARRTLYLASDQHHAAFLRAEEQRTRAIGFPVQRLSGRTLRKRYALEFPAALFAPGSAQVHAFAFARAVLRDCLRDRRFQLFQQTRVRSIRENQISVTLTTAEGRRVRARQVVIAAGYESGRFVKSKLVQLHSTYAIASKPFPPAALEPLRCLMWETARPYFYLRTTADHRIVFGGEDEPFANASRRDRKRKQKTRRLEARLAALFPQLAFRAEYAWAGTFAETTDGLPCIGAATPGSRVLFALGYGGNGITFSQIAARLLRDACTGKDNPDAALFAFDRLAKDPRSPARSEHAVRSQRSRGC